MKQGRNVKMLIAWRISSLAIPKDGGIADGIALFTTPGKLASVARDATRWVEAALSAVKAAPDNPHGGDDEAIAGAILDKINKARGPRIIKDKPR
jgi:hypothetical protein